MTEESAPTLAQIDADGAVQEARPHARRHAGAVPEHTRTRSAALLAELAAPERTSAAVPSDRDILNFALVLEYLQASFYTEAERRRLLKGKLAVIPPHLGAVERAHVTAFRRALGTAAVERPFFDFGGTTEQPTPFLKTAVVLEDLAVAAYKGQAGNIRSPGYLAAAISIHSVEARHAAWVRYLLGRTPAADAFDKPVIAQPRRSAWLRRRTSSCRRRRRRPASRRSTQVERAPRAAVVVAVVARGRVRLPLESRAPLSGGEPRGGSCGPPTAIRLDAAGATPDDAASHGWHYLGSRAPACRRAGRALCAGSRSRVVGSRTPEGTANVAVVTGVAVRGGRLWDRLALPVLPNDTEGWFHGPRSAATRSSTRVSSSACRRYGRRSTETGGRSTRAGRRRPAIVADADRHVLHP